MKWLNGVLLAFAATSIVLGIMGFQKHPASFYMAAGAGLVVILGVWLSAKKPAIGYGLCALIALANLGRFGPKLLQPEWKVAPDLVITIAAGVALIALIAGHLGKKPASA